MNLALSEGERLSLPTGERLTSSELASLQRTKREQSDLAAKAFRQNRPTSSRSEAPIMEESLLDEEARIKEMALRGVLYNPSPLYRATKAKPEA